MQGTRTRNYLKSSAIKKIKLILRYARHVLKAKNSRGHGVHSPMLFSFTQNVVYDKNIFYVFPEIEKLRSKLEKDDRIININDYGTGASRRVKVSHIAKKSLKRKIWAQLLYKVINFTNAKEILELGTSLGITTAYLASANSNIKCISLEGSQETAYIARDNIDYLGINNIKVIQGNIEKTLSGALSEFKSLDFVFFDANHRKEPTLKYFNQCLSLANNNSIFVFDDIHWSAEMEQAWEEIKQNERVTSTIDLFEIGIVFFNTYLPKKNYTMKR